jgi:hypothetical protein
VAEKTDAALFHTRLKRIFNPLQQFYCLFIKQRQITAGDLLDVRYRAMSVSVVFVLADFPVKRGRLRSDRYQSLPATLRDLLFSLQPQRVRRRSRDTILKSDKTPTGRHPEADGKRASTLLQKESVG